MSENLNIYNSNYSHANLQINPKTKYDAEMINIRQNYIKKYGFGKNILDLCCGTGSYLLPYIDNYKTAIGIDFSSNMLNILKSFLEDKHKEKLSLYEKDATDIDMVADNSIDFLYSYCSLYHVPNVEKAVKEVYRVLKNEGFSVLEFGNRRSLNTFVSNYHYENNGWAKPYYIDVEDMIRYLKENNFKIIEHRSFQLFPMLWMPKGYFYLYPLICPLWKYVLGIKVKGKMLDEYLSSFGILKKYSFRHIFLIQKQER